MLPALSARRFDALHNGEGMRARKDPHPEATATEDFALVIPSYDRPKVLGAGLGKRDNDLRINFEGWRSLII